MKARTSGGTTSPHTAPLPMGDPRHTTASSTPAGATRTSASLSTPAGATRTFSTTTLSSSTTFSPPPYFEPPFVEELHPKAPVYMSGLYRGSSPTYASTLEALFCLRAEKELLRGVWPNILRASLVTAGQVSSYDTCKKYLEKEWKWTPGVGMFVVSGLVSGFFSAVISAPVDVLRTRVMNDREGMRMIGKKDRFFVVRGCHRRMRCTLC